MDWEILDSHEKLAQLVEDSKKTELKAVAVFKHSTRCSISSMAKSRLERSWSLKEVPIYYLDLLSFRDISNAIANQFQIEHQSPQLIIIKNGEAVYHASHGAIDSGAVKEIL